MKLKRRTLILAFMMLLLSGCSGLYEGSMKSLEQDIISAELLELAEGYRDMYEKAVEEESLDDSALVRKITNYIGEQGYAVVDGDNQLNMQNSEPIEEFCQLAEAEKDANAAIITVLDEGRLHRYDLHASAGSIFVTENILSWEEGEPVISYTHSYEAYTWKYTELGYLFFEEYYPEGYDGAPVQVGIRIKPLDQTCCDLNRKYVLPIGYEGNNLLITDWDENNYGDVDFYDLFEAVYRMKYHSDVPYEENVIGTEYEIPEKEFEEVFQSYFQIDSSVLRDKTVYHENRQTYQYRPRTMYDAFVPYGPYPEVVSYEELSDGTVKLIVNAVWTRKYNDCAWSSELVVRPLNDGGFQYISNKVLPGFEQHEAKWYTPRLTDEEWEEYRDKNDVEGAEATSSNVEGKAGSATENGYNLPVSEEMQKTAEEDCKSVMEKIKNIYVNADKGTSINAVITRDTASQMLSSVKEMGCPAMASGFNLNVENYEVINDFLINAQNGVSGTVTIYEIHSGGGIDRKQFIFDGLDMYLLGTTSTWNRNQQPTINHTTYNRLKTWEYTKKGWFIYEYCLPEMTDRINGNDMFRVKPLDGNYREICEKYLLPVGYLGNNLLCSDWNENNMEQIDYNGLFQYLYEVKTGVKFNSDNYDNGVAKDEFESLMTEYLPVSKECIRQYAVYDENTETYVWKRVGYASYKLNFFAASFPEITDMQENGDGTTTLIVDAVCNLMGSDVVISHALTVEFTEDGGIRYLANQILDNGLEKIPEYQYRLGNK